MAEGEKSEPEESAKEVVKDFVQTLGLLDIIQGGLALYWVRLSLAENSTRLFPSTDHEVLDIALLICAAAVLGKALSLAVMFLTAVLRVLLNGLNVFGYRRRLEDLLDGALTKLSYPMVSPDDYRKKPLKIRPEELAMALVTAEDSAKTIVERIQTSITFSYSLVLLLIFYAAHFAQHGPRLLTPCLSAGVVLFFVLGMLHQLDLTRTLGSFLMVQVQPDAKVIEGIKPNENPH